MITAIATAQHVREAMAFSTLAICAEFGPKVSSEPRARGEKHATDPKADPQHL